MSEQNVKVVKRAVDAWKRGDIEGLLAVYHPEVVWDFSHFDGWPEEQVIVGADAVRAFLEQWRSTFGAYEYEVDEYIDAGDQVVVLCRQGGRGRDSTLPVIMELAQVVTIADGWYVRVENWSDRQAALDAVGVSST